MTTFGKKPTSVNSENRPAIADVQFFSNRFGTRVPGLKNNATNILKEVNLGSERSMTHRPLPKQAQIHRKHVKAMREGRSVSPSSYHEVVERLTKEPLAKVELKIAIENKSYDMQMKNMSMLKSRRLMNDEEMTSSFTAGNNSMHRDSQSPNSNNDYISVNDKTFQTNP